MRFKITVCSDQPVVIPVNYPYPLSAALYKIIAKGDAAYAAFLHERGYGRGFKFFTFSQIYCPFVIKDDRLLLKEPELSFQVAFHLPRAAESFVKGLFQSEQIDIADKKSRGRFTVKSVESLPAPLLPFKETEIVNVQLKPLSPVVAGIPDEKGHYDFLQPGDPRFTESLIYNWRSKIATCYNDATAAAALLLMEVLPMKQPFKSRLITIKYGKPEETKIRGWLNLRLKITAEKRFAELLMNGGVGVYNAQGMGFVEVIAN